MNRRKVLISALLLVTWLCVTAQNRTSQSNGTSGYWELVKTNIIQHEDTHNENGNYTLYTAKATEHTKKGKGWGIVGLYDDKELFDFSFVSSIQAPPKRITADSLVLHTVVERLSKDAPCYIRESATLTFEDTSTFLRHGCPEGVIRKLKGTKGVGTRKEHGKHSEWDFVISIPRGRKDKVQALNFYSCDSRTQWVYKWCDDTEDDTEDSTEAPQKDSGYWKQTDKRIARNYRLMMVDTVKVFDKVWRPARHDEQIRYGENRVALFSKKWLLTDVSYTRFHMRELYFWWAGRIIMDDAREVSSDKMDFNIIYTEPKLFYRSGEEVKSTYITTTSIPDGIDKKRNVNITPMMIAGGICKKRDSRIPLANTDATYLYNMAEDYSFKALTTNQNKWVDIEEHVSAKMPEGKEYGDVVYVRFEAHKDSIYTNIYYTYEWTEGDMPVMTSANDGNTGGSPTKDSPFGDMVPVILWLGGAGGGAVVALINRNRLIEFFKKYGTSDTKAIRQIQKQNQMKDVVEGIQYSIDADWADTGMEVSKDTLERDAVAFELGLAYMSGGMSLKGKLLATGGWSFLKTMAQRMEAGDSGGAALGKTVCKTLFDVAKTAFTSSTKIPALAKAIYSPFFDMFGDLPIKGQTGFTGGYWGSTFMKNYVNTAIGANTKVGFEHVSEGGQKVVEIISDYSWNKIKVDNKPVNNTHK